MRAEMGILNVTLNFKMAILDPTINLMTKYSTYIQNPTKYY